jgi:hypothetical protein
MTIRIVRAVQTSVACPAQWDAWDDAGNYYYLRYRHGHGSVRRYATPGWWSDFAADQLIGTVAEFDFGDPLDGSVSLAEFAVLAGVALADDLDETPFGRHVPGELAASTDDLVLRAVLEGQDPS